MNVTDLFQILLSLDEHILTLVSNYGFLSYFVLFSIIFFETGVVITPFLPGDSLLFAAGAVSALGGFNLILLIALLFIAAVAGDSLNYLIGKTWGLSIVKYAQKRNFIIKYSHIVAAENFYKKNGKNTIVIARFIPMIRTFAPFVAGIARMDYKSFLSYNILGGAIWVCLFVLGGYFFGNIPIVKENFSIVILVIIFFSILPGLISYFKYKKRDAHIA